MPSPIGGDKVCGAKTRAGKPCQNKPMANGRCRKHGGKSKGPPKGNKNALKHGFFSKQFSDEEMGFFDDLPTLDLDNDIRVLRIQIRRLLIEKFQVENDPDNEKLGFHLAEVKAKRLEVGQRKAAASLGLSFDDDRTDEEMAAELEEWENEDEDSPGQWKITVESSTVKKRPDYWTVYDRLVGRLAQLMQVAVTMQYNRNLKELEALKEEMETMRDALK